MLNRCWRGKTTVSCTPKCKKLLRRTRNSTSAEAVTRCWRRNPAVGKPPLSPSRCSTGLPPSSCQRCSLLFTLAAVLYPLFWQATDKKEAQHFFSSRTSEFFQHTVSRLGFTDVLCVGCPSVFEILPPATRSLLLDLDPRLQVHFLGFCSS